MKSQIIDAKVRELVSEIKRNISKQNAVIEVVLLKSWKVDYELTENAENWSN